MKIYKLWIYIERKNYHILDWFINNYKKRIKVIYENKICNLNIIKKWSIINSPKDLKIISFVDLQYLNLMFENTGILHAKEINRAIKINSDILPKKLIYNIFKMEYKINKEDNMIKIFGKTFVQNNKNKCLIIYRNNILPLKEFIQKTASKYEDKLEILLIDFAEIDDKIFIFQKSNILKEKRNDNIENELIKGINQEKYKKEEEKIKIQKIEENKDVNLFDVIQDKNISHKNANLNEIYEKLNFKNELNSETSNSNSNYDIKNMFLFLNRYVKSGTNINKEYNLFFTYNIDSRFSITNDIKEINKYFDFENCMGFNDITLNHLFNGYTKSLYSLLDKNQIFSNKIKDMSFMFDGCKSLISFTDLTKMNERKVTEICGMFLNCSSLITLPDISQWNINEITSMSSLFNGCSSLISLPDISKWKTNKVIYMNNMFKDCKSLKFIPDISKWNTANLINIANIFQNCSTIICLPDISNWDTRNINNMSNIFYGCSSLMSIPNISYWNTDKVEDISGMFYECSRLSSLPDISKWNTNQVNRINEMFYKCLSLKSLPDLSKWNFNKLARMEKLFYDCFSLEYIPDISKWNTSHIEDLTSIFYGCSLLKKLSDISYWDLQKCETIESMFMNCSSLLSLPDISKWNTKNIKFMPYLFSGCSSLISLPNISKWNMKNVTDISLMFYNCSSLISLPNIDKWDTSKISTIFLIK